MKKAVVGIAMSVLALFGVAIGAPTASAGVIQRHLPSGWQWTTRADCEQGRLVGWHRLSGPYGTYQGRDYFYVRNNRLCVFTVDHLAGAHVIDLSFRESHTGPLGWDLGYYNEYAGAARAPKNRCITVQGEVQVKHSNSTWEYTEKPFTRCIPS